MYKKSFKFLVPVFYLVMLVVNYLANALPINGMGTGELSDMYPNLFTPAGLTFSIWGLIYLLLGGFVVYQFFAHESELLKKLRIMFLLTSVANVAWIFAWHYLVVWLSLIIMVAFLVLLIKTADILRGAVLNKTEKIFLRLPFSVYFGWITVATIANATVFFVDVGSGVFGLSDVFWMILILTVGLLIGVWRTIKDMNAPYGLVLVWAYLGILLKHLSPEGFGGVYSSVLTTLYVCLAIFVVVVLYVATSDKKPTF